MSFVIIASVIAVGFFIVPIAKEAFRFPKDLLIRAESIVLIASWILLFLRGTKPAYRPADKPVALLVGAVIAWTGFTALIAINRTQSAYAFAWTVTIAVIFLSTYVVIGERQRMSDLAWLLVPAFANAILAICQVTRIWSPVRLEDETPWGMSITALIGNPNDTGGFFVAPLVVATALAIVSTRWRRGVCAAAAVVMLLGVVATGSRTSIVACVAGLACIAITASVHRWRALLALVAAGVIAGAALTATGRVSIDDVRRLKHIDALNQLLTWRVTPFLAAWRIFVDHPLTGVGPGCWAVLYFDQKVAIEHDHPRLFHSLENLNFAEVHNDHLEILAETGLLGYFLFIASLTFIGYHSFAKSGDEKGASETGRLARLLAFPAATALAVLCLAHFPLQLASTTSSFVFVFATAVGWLRR